MPRTIGLILAVLVIALLGSLVVVLGGSGIDLYVDGNLVATSGELNVEAGDGIVVTAQGNGTQTTYAVALDRADWTETQLWGPSTVNVTARTWLDTNVNLTGIEGYEYLRIRGKDSGDHIDVAVADLQGLTAGTAASAMAAGELIMRRVLVFDTATNSAVTERVFMLGKDSDSLLISFDQTFNANPYVVIFGLN